MTASNEELEYRVRRLEEEQERNLGDHKDFYARIEKVDVAQARIDTQYASIMATLGKVEAAIEELKSKPARRWDTIITSVITGVVGFLIAFVLHTA